jgi:hypothetical protein
MRLTTKHIYLLLPGLTGQSGNPFSLLVFGEGGVGFFSLRSHAKERPHPTLPEDGEGRGRAKTRQPCVA